MTDEIRNPWIAAWLARVFLVNEDPNYIKNARLLSATYDRTEDFHAEIARDRRFSDSRAPEALRAAVRSPRRTEALAAAQTHLAAPPACVFLVLAGPRGRGKTTALAWAVTEGGGLYVPAHDLVRAGTFDPVWSDLAAAPVLGLDELGAEHVNDAFRASLYDLLDTRYGNSRRTLIATNLDGEAFRQRYCPDPGDRLLERLTKGGRWVNLPGESMRTRWRDDKEPSP